MLVTLSLNPRLMTDRSDDLERAHQVAVHHHDGSGVVKLAAVVGRTEDGHQLSIGLELIAVLHDLVCSADEFQPMTRQEVLNDVVAECIRHSSMKLTKPRTKYSLIIAMITISN